MSRPIPMERAKTLTLYCLAAVVFVAGAFCRPARGESPAGTKAVSNEQAVRYGEAMYRKGVLPSGDPLMAVVKDDIPVEGTAFSCESCHLRGGMGSTEGGVYTPPTNGSRLFQPLKKIIRGVEVKYGEDPFIRPAYTDLSLAELLRYGIDPTGRIINDVMPRYEMNDTDMGYMIAYLKTLSSEFSPGVTDRTIHFATLYTEDVKAEDRQAMISGLEAYVAGKNAISNSFKRQVTRRDRMMAKAMSRTKDIEPRTLTLSHWVLKGPPETWRGQLEEYNLTDPAFALLGGLTTGGEWRPVHSFCEENRVPCIFPNTDYPVISETDWYTVYISKGYYQEGEAAARYLNGEIETLKGSKIVQVVRATRTGRSLVEGFDTTWREFGNSEAVTISLQEGETLTKDRLTAILAAEKRAVRLLWDGPAVVPALDALAAGKNRPQVALLSSTYLGDALWKLPAVVRDVTYVTYPYRLPQDQPIDPMGGKISFQVADNKIAKHTYALVQVLTMAVMEIKEAYYRDTFLDAIGNSMDRIVPLYERLSFGPGQRYASKGCYIVQLTGGEKPELVKKTPWVIH